MLFRKQGFTEPEVVYGHKTTSCANTFTAWLNVGELFVSPTDAELEAAMGVYMSSGRPLFPVQADPFPSCQTRAWKSPQWCHSDDFVIVTLMCTDDRLPPPQMFGFGTFTSRVVLVDLREGVARFYDLTRELERLLDVPLMFRGSYRAIFATCGTPS